MITLKQTQKAKINQLVEKFNIAKKHNVWNIFAAYDNPSQEIIRVYRNIVEQCIDELRSEQYYIVGHNCNTFSMICKYIKWNDAKKQYETRLRYWTSYNTYDCEVVL